jgi:leucyl aminopeptidase
LSDVLLAAAPHAVPVDAIAADAAGRLSGRTAEWAAASGFKAAAGSVLLVPGADGAIASVLLGLGSGLPDRFAAGRLATALPPGIYRLREGFDDPALAALAFALGAYRFTRYRPSEDAGIRLVLPDGVDRDLILRTAEAVNFARDLINTPANDLGPAELAEAAAGVARARGAAIRIIDGAELARDFPMIHAVGAAATDQRRPRLVDIAWGDPSHPKVTLVGKGVCFDTGGLDIKPASGMLLMKKDMGGAANILALARMVMGADLPVNLRVLVPAVENAIAGPAFRPGDVLRSRKGVTVEIGNTDAEGRLVLADALALAAEESPDLVIDLATLTGAARVALGPEVVPFYTRDDGLAADLARHGEQQSDPLWRLPLWQPYRSMLDSKVADINNAGSAPFAGSITAALFLARFVPDEVPWIHGDIYAWNPSAKPGRPEGGEAQMIRALYALIAGRYRR